MIDSKDSGSCTGCGACATSCPKGCISMCPDEWGFLYPTVDIERCTNCGACDQICPLKSAPHRDGTKRAYAAYHLDTAIRDDSSSGGVFTALAENVIRNGGVVFGAVLDKSMVVRHSLCDTIEGLEAFRGSKYVQSEIGDCYSKAKEFLSSGRQVLFSGTPCQVAGLRAYLGKSYDNLLCQDIICHGVPSPAVWQRYLLERQREYRGQAQAACFRNKQYGWEHFSIKIEFENGKAYTNVATQDGFMKSFLGNFSLRPSCYQCSFKQDQRLSDITLADFWGIDQVEPEMNDGHGTSLVLIHSLRGQKLLDSVSAVLNVKEVNWEKAIALNPAINTSVALPEKREGFMRAVFQNGFDFSVKKYCDPSVLDRIKALCYRTLRIPEKIKFYVRNRGRSKKKESVPPA